MSKKKPLISNPAISGNSLATKEENSVKFNFVTDTKSNPFHSIFDTQSHRLNQKEEAAFKELLTENYDSKAITKEQLPKDLILITQMTVEIRSIANQGAYLIGERVANVRDVLKRYSQDTFGKWLEMAFNSRRTGYNFLAFYELWKELPNDEVKDKYRRMPKSAAYMLASREVGLTKKVTFIDKFFDLKPKILLLKLRKMFPAPNSTRGNQTTFSQLKNLIEKFTEEAEYFSKEELKDLKLLQKEIGKVTMKYLAIPKPKVVSLEKTKNNEALIKLVELAGHEGERTIIQYGLSSAAIVPLEDLVLLENEEKR